MLLAITTTHRPASDLSFLLHKRPDRVQSFDLSFGKAQVFYPEVESERTTAALLLDVDPASRFSILNLVGVEHIVEKATGLRANAFMRRSLDDGFRNSIKNDLIEVF